MTDRVLLSASDRNIEDCIRLALDYQLGIELMAFAFPNVLDGDWQATIARYKRLLRPVVGARSMHGPFMDMAPGSPDRRINALCYERYQHAIRIASELEIPIVIFHANFIAAIHNIEYRVGWHQRNLDFWSPVADYAHRYGVTVAVENMWEFDPDIIGDLLKEINHPNLRACLDVGHAHLFGEEVPFEHWLTSLGDLIVHTHMNNNDGKIDIHMGFDHGVLDYNQLLPEIRALPNSPTMTLEMDEVDFMKNSLPFMDLVKPYQPEFP
jgi:sugar phosphate isomerase/epimerase